MNPLHQLNHESQTKAYCNLGNHMNWKAILTSWLACIGYFSILKLVKLINKTWHTSKNLRRTLRRTFLASYLGRTSLLEHKDVDCTYGHVIPSLAPVQRPTPLRGPHGKLTILTCDSSTVYKPIWFVLWPIMIQTPFTSSFTLVTLSGSSAVS